MKIERRIDPVSTTNRAHLSEDLVVEITEDRALDETSLFFWYTRYGIGSHINPDAISVEKKELENLRDFLNLYLEEGR